MGSALLCGAVLSLIHNKSRHCLPFFSPELGIPHPSHSSSTGISGFANLCKPGHVRGIFSAMAVGNNRPPSHRTCFSGLSHEQQLQQSLPSLSSCLSRQGQTPDSEVMRRRSPSRPRNRNWAGGKQAGAGEWERGDLRSSTPSRTISQLDHWRQLESEMMGRLGHVRHWPSSLGAQS